MSIKVSTTVVLIDGRPPMTKTMQSADRNVLDTQQLEEIIAKGTNQMNE